MFFSATKAHFVNTIIALATSKKGNLSLAEYVSKIHALGDELTNSGKTIDNDKHVSYILTSLEEEYNPVMTYLVARVEPVTVADTFA